MIGVKIGFPQENVMKLNTPSPLRVRRLARRIAFTLVEMMIVVAIIVLLAGVGTYYMAGSIDEGNKAKAAADVKSITDAATAYKAQHSGNWPPSIQDLYTRAATGYGPYLKNAEDQISPWGQPYQYDPSGPNNQGLQPDVSAQITTGTGGRVVNWSRKIVQ
jgi:general secretion pathway protein G